MQSMLFQLYLQAGNTAILCVHFPSRRRSRSRHRQSILSCRSLRQNMQQHTRTYFLNLKWSHQMLPALVSALLLNAESAGRTVHWPEKAADTLPWSSIQADRSIPGNDATLTVFFFKHNTERRRRKNNNEKKILSNGRKQTEKGEKREFKYKKYG